MRLRRAVRCGGVLSALGVSFLTAILSGMNFDGHSDDLTIVLLAHQGLVPQDTMVEIAARSTEESRGSRWDAVVANSSNDIDAVDPVPVGTKSYAARQMPESSVSEYTTNFARPTIRTPKAENAR